MITSDPIRSGNLAYKGYGTSGAHRILETNIESTISWEEFDLSLEFMATSGYLSIKQNIKNDTYEMGVGVLFDNRMPGYTDYLVLVIEEYGSYTAGSWALIPISTFSYNQWYKIHSWYDEQSNLFMTELLISDTEQLVAQASRTPAVDYSVEPRINSTFFGIEEVNWQYVDNVVLTPEPTTLSLFAIEAILLRRRRAYTCK